MGGGNSSFFGYAFERLHVLFQVIDVLSMLYYGLVYSKLQYGILVWDTAVMKYLNEIQVNMNKIIRSITNISRHSSLSPLYKKLNFLKLTEIYKLIRTG